MGGAREGFKWLGRRGEGTDGEEEGTARGGEGMGEKKEDFLTHIMERARILRDDIQLPPQRAKRPPVNTVAMRRAQHIRPRLVNRAMDHKRRRVQQPHLPTRYHRPRMVHLDQIAPLHQREGYPERVHPEGGRVHRVPDRDVPCYAFVEAVFAEDAQGGGEPPFEVFALFVLVGEFGGAGESGHLYFGLSFG